MSADEIGDDQAIERAGEFEHEREDALIELHNVPIFARALPKKAMTPAEREEILIEEKDARVLWRARFIPAQLRASEGLRILRVRNCR